MYCHFSQGLSTKQSGVWCVDSATLACLGVAQFQQLYDQCTSLPKNEIEILGRRGRFSQSRLSSTLIYRDSFYRMKWNQV